MDVCKESYFGMYVRGKTDGEIFFKSSDNIKIDIYFPVVCFPAPWITKHISKQDPPLNL